MFKKSELQSELGEDVESSEELSLMDIFKIFETSGDVLDHKIFNHDYKMASYFPTPGIEESKGPYFEEEDYYRFFSGEDDPEEDSSISGDSIPKVNSSRKRYNEISKIYGSIK